MENSNEVTSQPAEVVVVPVAATPEVKRDAEIKGNASESSVTKLLASRELERMTATLDGADKRGSIIAADNKEKTAASGETSTSTANPEAKLDPKAQAEAKVEPEEASDVPFNLSHLTDPKQKAIVEAELKKYKESNQRSIDTRIGKLTAKAKALESQLEQTRLAQPARSPIDAAPVQQQVQQQAQPIRVPFPAEVPFANISDPALLHQEARTAQRIQAATDDALTAGPTGARVDETGKRIDLYDIDGTQYTKEQVINARRNAREALQMGIPARMEDLRQRQENSALAVKTFPWIRNPQTPEFQRAALVANGFPFLKNLPNAENIIGMIVEGLYSTEAKAAAAKGQEAPRRSSGTPPSDQVAFSAVGRSASRAPTAEATKQALADERAKLNGKKGVSGRDMAKYFLASDNVRNSR